MQQELAGENWTVQELEWVQERRAWDQGQGQGQANEQRERERWAQEQGRAHLEGPCAEISGPAGAFATAQEFPMTGRQQQGQRWQQRGQGRQQR
jgi:hypothetical protein